MAKVVSSGDQWVFDAATQCEGHANRAESGVIFNTVRPYIRFIVIQGGVTGGDFEVTEKSGGRTITGVVNVAANDEWVHPVYAPKKGVYMKTLVAAGKITVHHGQPLGT